MSGIARCLSVRKMTVYYFSTYIKDILGCSDVVKTSYQENLTIAVGFVYDISTKNMFQLGRSLSPRAPSVLLPG